MKNKFSALSLSLLALAACEKSVPDYAAWTGKWTGVEGTYLSLIPQEDGVYKVEIADLDGPREFTGTAKESGIEFTRNGETHVIRAGTGEETGMKWLADKQNCLVVSAHEGYCRD